MKNKIKLCILSIPRPWYGFGQLLNWYWVLSKNFHASLMSVLGLMLNMPGDMSGINVCQVPYQIVYPGCTLHIYIPVQLSFGPNNLHLTQGCPTQRTKSCQLASHYDSPRWWHFKNSLSSILRCQNCHVYGRASVVFSLVNVKTKEFNLIF